MEQFLYFLLGLAAGSAITGMMTFCERKDVDTVVDTYDDNHGHVWSKWEITPYTGDYLQRRFCKICGLCKEVRT